MDYNSELAESESLQMSKINSAGIVNSTMNNLWIDFYRHYRAGQFLSANSDLDCIWTILGGEKGMADSEDETKYFKIEAKIGEFGLLRDSIEINGFGKLKQEQINTQIKQKDILLKKSLFLRRLQNEQGKGTAYISGDDEETE